MSTEEYADQEGQASLPAVREKPELAVVPAPPQQNLTPQQARVDAVSNVLHKAYEKASTLELSPEQVKALKADFPDEAFKLGAGGNPDLIYIEHAYLRDRFDEVLGMGQWALVRSRPHWGEDYVTGKGQKAVRIYADCALLIKGCLVSEAIGEMTYFPNNASQSYGDAAEGSETAAFRRCAKKLGVGLQAWKKDFCMAWMAKHAKGATQSRPAPAAPAKTPAPAPAPKTKVSHDKADLLSTFRRYFPANMEESLVNFLRSEADSTGVSWLMPNEGLEDLSIEKLEILAKSPTKMLARVQQWMDSLADGETPATSTTADDEPWYKVVVPVPRKGMKRDEYLRNPDTIGSLYQLRHEDTEEGQLARQRLWGFVTNYEPKGWVKRDGTQMPPSESDIQFKEALEQFKAWFERNHPGEKL